MPVASQLKDRFESKIKTGIPGDCWEWLGSKDGCGYGRISLNNKPQRAHRVSLYLATGVFPSKHLLACHRCDNPSCVNPLHLFLGTVRDNAIDAKLKGRLATRINGRKHDGNVVSKANGKWKHSHQNGRRTNCMNGHPLTDDNVIANPIRGGRSCRTCCNKRKRDKRRSLGTS